MIPSLSSFVSSLGPPVAVAASGRVDTAGGAGFALLLDSDGGDGTAPVDALLAPPPLGSPSATGRQVDADPGAVLPASAPEALPNAAWLTTLFAASSSIGPPSAAPLDRAPDPALPDRPRTTLAPDLDAAAGAATTAVTSASVLALLPAPALVVHASANLAAKPGPMPARRPPAVAAPRSIPVDRPDAVDLAPIASDKEPVRLRSRDARKAPPPPPAAPPANEGQASDPLAIAAAIIPPAIAAPPVGPVSDGNASLAPWGGAPIAATSAGRPAVSLMSSPIEPGTPVAVSDRPTITVASPVAATSAGRPAVSPTSSPTEPDAPVAASDRPTITVAPPIAATSAARLAVFPMPWPIKPNAPVAASDRATVMDILPIAATSAGRPAISPMSSPIEPDTSVVGSDRPTVAVAPAIDAALIVARPVLAGDHASPADADASYRPVKAIEPAVITSLTDRTAWSAAAGIVTPVTSATPAVFAAEGSSAPPPPSIPARAAASTAGARDAGATLAPALPLAQSVRAATVAASGTIAPASEVFAAAIHAAGRERLDAPRDDDGSVRSAMAFAAAPPAPGVVAAPAGRDDATLDMRHGDWPGAMVDHIEKLRDAADAVDTRIRLVPDALGGIDVALRRGDDGVQVTLRADQPATQTLLAEARPQLTAMAEARGIRLADAGLAGAGGGMAGDPSTAGGRRRPPAFVPTAPASATVTPTNFDPANGRVA